MTAAQTIEPDRRRHVRRRVLKRGKAIFNDNKTVIDCMIRDLSEGGARLVCAQAVSLPSSFQLIFVAERQMREVRVAWRRAEELGVEFLSGPHKPLLRLL